MFSLVDLLGAAFGLAFEGLDQVFLYLQGRSGLFQLFSQNIACCLQFLGDAGLFESGVKFVFERLEHFFFSHKTFLHLALGIQQGVILVLESVQEQPALGYLLTLAGIPGLGGFRFGRSVSAEAVQLCLESR